MLLVKTSNGQIEQFPYTFGDLLLDNPHTSFPKSINNDLLASYEVYPVTLSTQPAYDATVQVLVRDSIPYKSVEGWVVGYTVENKPQEQAEAKVRSKREWLLAETDWTALSDNTMTTAMAEYRQALRDVTSQEGFPYDVTWPTKPE
jgi:hypothetical protein